MWKSNWEDTKQHFIDWWNHDGLVIGMWGAPKTGGPVHEELPEPPAPSSIEEQYANVKLRAKRQHYDLSRSAFPADILPISESYIGPGCLALYCGCEPDFSHDTIWFKPCMQECSEPEKLPPIRFDESNYWFSITEATVKECLRLSDGRYLVDCPDLTENVDILASMREPQTLLMDMIERPEWVEQKVAEINRVWFEVFERIYDTVKLEDGSSTFGAFRLWGPGKTAKVQCDASAMFSPDMFERFVLPGLREQCDWLDHSMYHLDGTQAMVHLEMLLDMESLNAIEWTPQAGIEDGGDPRWHDMCRRILGAGKSLQVIHIKPDEIIPLLDAIGGKGVYILTSFSSTEEAETIMAMVDKYR